jgi:hypothetical protein
VRILVILEWNTSIRVVACLNAPSPRPIVAERSSVQLASFRFHAALSLHSEAWQ